MLPRVAFLTQPSAKLQGCFKSAKPSSGKVQEREVVVLLVTSVTQDILEAKRTNLLPRFVLDYSWRQPGILEEKETSLLPRFARDYHLGPRGRAWQ